MKVFVEKAEADPTAVAGGLATMCSSRLEHVRGADASWMAKRRGHRRILDYLTSLPLIKKASASLDKQLKEWLELSNQLNVLPNSVWIAGLWNPMGYITACLQVTARRKGLPLDTMEIATETGIATIATPLASANIARSPHPADGTEIVTIATTKNPTNRIHRSFTSKSQCFVNICGRKQTKARPMRITTSIASRIA